MKPQLIRAHDSLFHYMNHPNLPSYLESMLAIKATESKRRIDLERENKRDGFHRLASFSLLLFGLLLHLFLSLATRFASQFCCLATTTISLNQWGGFHPLAIWLSSIVVWSFGCLFINWKRGGGVDLGCLAQFKLLLMLIWAVSSSCMWRGWFWRKSKEEKKLVGRSRLKGT